MLLKLRIIYIIYAYNIYNIYTCMHAYIRIYIHTYIDLGGGRREGGQLNDESQQPEQPLHDMRERERERER